MWGDKEFVMLCPEAILQEAEMRATNYRLNNYSSAPLVSCVVVRGNDTDTTGSI